LIVNNIANFSDLSRKYFKYIQLCFSVERTMVACVEIMPQTLVLDEAWQIAQNQRNIRSSKSNIFSTIPLVREKDVV
jgi:hypothetical protein